MKIEMSKLLRRACIVAAVALIFLIGIFVHLSMYSVNYRVIDNSIMGKTLEVKWEGPACKVRDVFVILTDPKGVSTSVRYPNPGVPVPPIGLGWGNDTGIVMVPLHDYQAGTWVLAIKDLEMKKVFWKKEIIFP